MGTEIKLQVLPALLPDCGFFRHTASSGAKLNVVRLPTFGLLGDGFRLRRVSPVLFVLLLCAE